ncbi:nuclear transport factor 2 family protein [Streptomyces sp. DG2A-72]|uniref:YybH family protein n=1 Tax=Streptomyces sp. DG2A-72 TaxID=3051386 RepID=UPI00265B92F7|nr:nuclear transport factor 2 family protein [Streptomyces sp. DG2A-72]MDO0939343.1 nuclear transport factor 2 family protein [Streptomyces sp. DG2A-72]
MSNESGTVNNAVEDRFHKHTDDYVRAFNSGDADQVNAFYTDEAVAVWEPGKPLTGQARKEYTKEFLSRRPVMRATVRQSFATKETALLIVDWHMDVSGEVMEGVGVDVLRLGDDGTWRYAIDDPFGEEKK